MEQLPPIPKDRIEKILKIVNFVRTRPGRKTRKRDIPQKLQGPELSDAVFYNFLRQEMKGTPDHPIIWYVAPMTDGEVYQHKLSSIYRLVKNLPIKTYKALVARLEEVEDGDLPALDRLEQKIRAHFGDQLDTPQPGSQSDLQDQHRLADKREREQADIAQRRAQVLRNLSASRAKDRRPDFRFEKADLLKNCQDLPTFQQIQKRVDAIADGDVQALVALRDKIYAYYEKKVPGLHEGDNQFLDLP